MNATDQAELDVLYATAPVGLCLIDTDLRFQRINEAMAEINGVSVADHLGQAVAEVVPDLLTVATATMTEMLASGAPVGPFEVTGETAAQPGVRRHWLETWSPIRNQSGEIVAASVVALDVTERKIHETRLTETLTELERGLAQRAALAHLSTEALDRLDLRSLLERAARLAANALDVPLTKILRFAPTADRLELVAGVGWQEGLVGAAVVGTDDQSQAGFTLLSQGPVVVKDLLTEQRFSGPPLLHQHGVRSGISVVISGTGVRPFGVFGIHTTKVRRFTEADVDFLVSLAAVIANAARREQAESQRTLLIREMAHRAGNMLQLVSSIASQTFKAEDIKGSLHKFNDRLGALARANYSIAVQGWTETRLIEVIRHTLAPFSDRLLLAGPDVLLPAELCFDFGLILHELATNSAKYGAVASDGGTVQISWGTEVSPAGSAGVWLSWEDHGAIAVANGSDQVSTGFGTRLISSLVRSKWRGTLEVGERENYCMTLRVPLATSP